MEFLKNVRIDDILEVWRLELLKESIERATVERQVPEDGADKDLGKAPQLDGGRMWIGVDIAFSSNRVLKQLRPSPFQEEKVV